MPLVARSHHPVALDDEAPSPTVALRRFDRPDVAGLSCADIQGLTFDELVSVVQTAPPPTVPLQMLGHLEYQNREVLERLAFLARECCRNRGDTRPSTPR